MSKKVCVLISTYNRAHLLEYALKSLSNQTYANFEVLIVYKPSGDATEVVAEKFAKTLKIRLVKQTKGHVVDAVNLGLKNAGGDIIAFLDDDAIPSPDWIQRHVETYDRPNVGGVAGDVIPSFMEGEKLVVGSKTSEVIPEVKPFLINFAYKLWSCPLNGQEDYLIYISKAGMVAYNFSVAQQASHQVTKSLLGMGTNMSVLAKAVKGFQLPNSWVLGLSYEQFLGWHIWKNGFNTLFNPEAKVYHLSHGQTLTRQVTDYRKYTLKQLEGHLLFYRLYFQETNLSYANRIVWWILTCFQTVKKICRDKDTSEIQDLRNLLRPEVVGLKWNLSRIIGGSYNPLMDLEALNR